MEPRIEPIWIPQSGQLSPCVDERFLDGVLGPLPVPQDEGRDRKEAVASCHRESLEGLVIAAPRRFHDIALHRLLHRRQNRSVLLSPYDGAGGPNRSNIGPSRASNGLLEP